MTYDLLLGVVNSKIAYVNYEAIKIVTRVMRINIYSAKVLSFFKYAMKIVVQLPPVIGLNRSVRLTER